MRLIKTTEDEQSRENVDRIVKLLEGVCKSEFAVMAAAQPDDHPQRHLAVLTSSLVTTLSRVFNNMYHCVGIERTASDRERFSKINQLMQDEIVALANKYEGTSN